MQKFSKNVYSQNGEDGIIEEILYRISKKFPKKIDKWCVELGAWDGIYLSNTCNLIKNKNYNALLIEANNKKYKELCKNFPSENIIKVKAFVGFKKDNSLDSFFKKYKLPKNFDFLSIDVNGIDYYLFESLKIYKPKVICVEYNFMIPNEINFIQEKNFNISQGSSALAFYNLAQKKGYDLIAATMSNLIFVSKNYSKYIYNVKNSSLNKIRDDSKYKNYIFMGYDGTLFTSKPLYFYWHRIEVSNSRIQIIPKYLRKFIDNYSFLQKIFYIIFSLYKAPNKKMLNKIIFKLKKTFKQYSKKTN